MSLPQIKLPIRKLTLSDGSVVDYRPFTVKEEKLLLLAKEEGKESIKYDTVIQIINNCTFGKLKLNQLSTVDIEKLFINIRCESVGSQVTLSFICKGDVEEGGLCNKVINVPVDLEKTLYPETPKDLKTEFDVDDTIKIFIKPPTLSTLTKTVDDVQYNDIIFYIDKVVDGENVTEADDVTLDELESFFEDVPFTVKTEIAESIDQFPKAQQTIDYSCSCGNKGEYTIRGIANFFI